MQTLPRSLHIGVVRGGPSPEYDVSLKTGGHVLEHLRETHIPIDIFISRDSKWHMQGIERSPERILKHVDVIFNALHGKYGEDGGVQEILDHHGTKYTGSGRYSSAIAMNKWLTKEKAKSLGIKTPLSSVVKQNDDIEGKNREILSSIPYPLIIKPCNGGSSMGLHVAHTSKELLEAVSYTLENGSSALVEEYIPGKEASCGVINNFRNKGTYALPPVEIISSEQKIICPGNFSQKEKEEIERISSLVHDRLGISHYSKSDFIVSPKRGVYFLEINALPKLGEKSIISKSLEAIGGNMKEFLHHVIGLAIK